MAKFLFYYIVFCSLMTLASHVVITIRMIFRTKEENDRLEEKVDEIFSDPRTKVFEEKISGDLSDNKNLIAVIFVFTYIPIVNMLMWYFAIFNPGGLNNG